MANKNKYIESRIGNFASTRHARILAVCPQFHRPSDATYRVDINFAIILLSIYALCLPFPSPCTILPQAPDQAQSRRDHGNLCSGTNAVQFVNQPEAAIEIFAGQQLRAVAGGRHPGWGTRNALSYFGLTYIEFLAIADPDELRAATDKFLLSRDAARLLPENEALFRVALRSDDIDATYDQLRRTGVTVSPIVDGQRNDPQGNIIRWRIFTIYGDTDGLVYPFVLQWEEDDATRLTRLRAQRLDAPHPLGDITLEQAVFEVVNPQAVRDRWQALLGFPPLGEQGLDVGGRQFIFREGAANQLTELVFRVANPALKGQRFRVGNGVYRFT